jgi:hypothetical protein
MKKKIINKVINFPKKYEAGFMESEIEELLKGLDINLVKFNDALSKTNYEIVNDEKIIYSNDLVSIINSSAI